MNINIYNFAFLSQNLAPQTLVPKLIEKVGIVYLILSKYDLSHRDFVPS
jgi:hypothetical protein